jgi:predicted flap endonuclease-1-like 5' DNA nuclease
MLFTSPTQYIVLALILVVGWLFGLASHPGGRKWRTRFEHERTLYAEYHRNAEARIRDAERRAEELEAENARLTRAVAPPAPAAPVIPAATVAATTAAVEDMPPRRGWFSWGGSDDLARIRGIDGAIADRLESVGVKRYRDIERLSGEDEIALEQRIALPAGYIAANRWREQAALLREGNVQGFGERP